MPTNHLSSEELPEGQWCHLSTDPVPRFGHSTEHGSLLSHTQDLGAVQFYGHPYAAWTEFKGGDDHEDDNWNRVAGGSEREPMFEKPLTPSDVGKLNRLVIPKQHAERYFPLDSEKGLQLSFEDEAGKVWRFRYSYWNSSQSYVLTKGWSRFVKEKQLDAGDVVSFERFRPDAGRLYIGWRRRPAATVAAPQPPSGVATWAPAFFPGHLPYPPQLHGTCMGGGGVHENSPAPATPKRLRLFGVNLDFPADESAEPDGVCWSSQDRTDEIFFRGVQSNGPSSQA